MKRPRIKRVAETHNLAVFELVCKKRNANSFSAGLNGIIKQKGRPVGLSFPVAATNSLLDELISNDTVHTGRSSSPEAAEAGARADVAP